MELRQAVSGASAGGAAAQGLTDKAREQLEKVAACKAYRDVCGTTPDVGCKAHYDVMSVLVRGAYASAEAELAQLARVTAPAQWRPPRCQQRRMPVNSGALVKTASKSKCASSLQGVPLRDPKTDPKYAGVRRALTCRPTTALRHLCMYSQAVDPHLKPGILSPASAIVPPAPSVQAVVQRAAASPEAARVHATPTIGHHVTATASDTGVALLAVLLLFSAAVCMIQLLSGQCIWYVPLHEGMFKHYCSLYKLLHWQSQRTSTTTCALAVGVKQVEQC